MKLEPTAAQVEAVSDYIDRFRASAEYKSSLVIAQEIFAALNSIPEGAPVGTIARAPDGHNIAVRKQFSDGVHWAYLYDSDVDIFGYKVADSWPVIYDPDEYHEGDKPRLERLMREPSVFDADSTAQQEPCCGVSEVYDCDCPPAIRITPKPRTPRVVDSLGVDEQGSRWRDVIGDVWNWDERGWHCVAKYGPTSPVPYLAGETALHGPFKEILEPRVLPSLDCEEARDGTVWEAAFSQSDHGRGWKFWYVLAEREWYTDAGHDGSSPLRTLDFLTERGPYTEVLGDPS